MYKKFALCLVLAATASTAAAQRSSVEKTEAIPGMIGDYFGGFGTPISGTTAIDRLMVLSNDMDAPPVLPPVGSTLTITEAGPVPIVSGALNIQQLQTALGAGAPLPTLTLEGNVADSATMTTALTVGQIQAQLAATAEAYDIVALVAPPGSYDTAVDTLFLARNTLPGTTAYDAAGSGALLQAGDDTLTGGEDFDAFYFYTYNVALDVPTPGAAFGNMGRLKVADGNSAIPLDRVYFRYGMFDNVAGPAGDVSLDRFVPGFEKAFVDNMFSLEVRTPFAGTVSNEGSVGPGGVVGSDALLGNVVFYSKALLMTRRNFALSGGLGVAVPTAEDVEVTLADGTPVVQIENEAVHLKPYLALLCANGNGWYYHGFLEIDVDANGNSVDANLGNGLSSVGTLNDATYLFADFGVGYRVVRPGATIRALSPTVEIHYNDSLSNADSVQAGPLLVGSLDDNLSVVNSTVGATMELGNSAYVAMGYVTPLGGGNDRQLDGGFRLTLEYRPW